MGLRSYRTEIFVSVRIYPWWNIKFYKKKRRRRKRQSKEINIKIVGKNKRNRE
jgi:hypothetical protein